MIERRLVGHYRSIIGESGACDYDLPEDSAVIIIRVAKTLPEIKKTVVLNYSNTLGDDFDLWLLIDHTDLDPKAFKALEEDLRDVQTRASYPVHMLLYDLELEKAILPTAVNRFNKIGSDINYYTHTVSVVVWWRLCGRHSRHQTRSSVTGPTHANHEHNLPRIWIVEMDAGFSGNPKTFFTFYQNKQYDLIANNVSRAPEEWVKEARLRAKDTWELPDEYYYRKGDFVVGLSCRLLYHLDLLVRSSIIPYGEVYESTVCETILNDWCVARSFAEDGFAGEVLVWDGMIGVDQWRLYNEQAEFRNKWYHAVLAHKEHGPKN